MSLNTCDESVPPKLYPVAVPDEGVRFCLRPVPGVTGEPVQLTFSQAARYAGACEAEAERIAEALRADVLSRLSLVRKAGALTPGYEKVKELLRSKRGILVLQASDGSPREQARLLTGSGGVRTEKVFTADELGVVCGRANAHHVGLTKTAFAADWMRNLDAYMAFING